MKRVLGLDLGTNSIGWALVEEDKIIGMGSRIIPMDQKQMGEFDSGNSVSQTAERTRLRGVRRLVERKLQRRERLHRVLNILGYLPEHYANAIDFEKKLGQFKEGLEPKIAYTPTEEGKHQFIFEESYQEMLEDFRKSNPEMLSNGRLIPKDWTLYYLRKKALTNAITPQELAWVLLNFNQKRGYFQLRGEDEDTTGKIIEYMNLKVTEVTADTPNPKGDIWYNITFENGMVYRRTSKTPLDWLGKEKEFIVTTDINEDGTPKLTKDGDIKRSFRVPSADDWTLIKKRSEQEIEVSGKTVGAFIYENLLHTPDTKIKGGLVRTIERKFYRRELFEIVKRQMELHPKLQDRAIYENAINELYPNNDIHRQTIASRNFAYLIVSDVILYQRPLKSKKSTIGTCRYEQRVGKDKEGKRTYKPLACIAKSNPYFEEIRLWQFISNLKIYQREREVAGKLYMDFDVTKELLPDESAWSDLFRWLSLKAEITQADLLAYEPFNIKKGNRDGYRWNYVEDKRYPTCPTRKMIVDKLIKCDSIFPKSWDKKKLVPKIVNIIISPFDDDKKSESIKSELSKNKIDTNEANRVACLLQWRELEYRIWHLLYSVEEKEAIVSALEKLRVKLNVGDDLVENISKAPQLVKTYGSYSEKAIKKLLPLVRRGEYRTEAINENTLLRIAQIKERLESINFDKSRVMEVVDSEMTKAMLTSFCPMPNLEDGMSSSQACYATYGRYSEDGETFQWKNPSDIKEFLDEFKQHTLKNPIVEQVVTETLRVVQDIWSKFGGGQSDYFSEIHLELGREMKNPADKRKAITERVTAGENTNLRLRALLMELKNDAAISNVRPNSPFQLDLLKIYEEDVLSAEHSNIPDDILKISRLAQPSKSDLIRYKLWLDQKYQSPYTGEMIPLARLFTPDYQIEHIIPQSIYFDDSLTNKVICEAVVNASPYKGNQFGMEFIQNQGGRVVTELARGGRQVKILTVEQYQQFVKSRFSNNTKKMEKLLLTEVPQQFIARQLNDTRYISKYICNLLSNIVRENDEMQSNAKRLIVCNGGVTSQLKKDWGLNDVWNNIIAPRFIRLNEKRGNNDFGEWVERDGKRFFMTKVPFDLLKGFNKKRIDHRHHAMDALVISCATRNHINYLNNQSANGTERRDLRSLLCVKTKQDSEGNYSWLLKKPWDTFTQDAKKSLDKIIVSFKNNTRVITKTSNHYQKWVIDQNGSKHKELVKQTSGNSWAIRKPLHKDTVSGLVTLRQVKEVAINVALKEDAWKNLLDKRLKKKIKELVALNYNEKNLTKYFKDANYKFEGRDVKRVQIYYFDNEVCASRIALSDSFTQKQLESVTDSGIRTILSKHAENYDGKFAEAFSPDGIDMLNANIKELNGGKPHQPIYKVRTSEPKGMKFQVGYSGNKSSKFVEAAKGTNLFYAIYQDESGKRSYDTIGLSTVVERMMQGISPVPETNGNSTLLMYLNPGDLVYLPTPDEVESQARLSIEEIKEKADRIYKLVSSDKKQSFFIPMQIASPIVQTEELGSNNKAERAWSNEIVKNHCLKLTVNRLGEITHIIQ